MNRLRIYRDAGGADTLLGAEVFYVSRGGGPCYRWCCEAKPVGWRFSRVYPSASILRALSVANLKDMPASLRMRLDEHYAKI